MRRNDSLALSTIFRSMHLPENSNDLFRSISLYDIAVVYYNIGDYSRAISYSYVLQTTVKPKEGFNIQSDNIIGKSFYQLNELDSAKRHLELAYKNSLPIKLPTNVALIFLGHIYRLNGDYIHAIEYYRRGIESSFNKDFTLKEAREGYVGLAQTFQLNRQYDSALSYSKIAFSLATANSFSAQKLDAAILSKDLYAQSGAIDSAFKYQGITLSLKDSLFNQENYHAEYTPVLKKKPYWGNHFWARGYFVNTVDIDKDIIKRYVKISGR